MKTKFGAVLIIKEIIAENVYETAKVICPTTLKADIVLNNKHEFAPVIQKRILFCRNV